MASGPSLLKEKDKPKKQRAKTTSQLKKELDKVFSQYIRQSYAINNGKVPCYTCPKIINWKEIQNGHFVSRQHLATRYDERNCRPQCVGCNIFGNGRIALFATKLEQETPGIVSTLYRQAQETIKNFPYEEKIKEYQIKLQEIKK